MKLKKILAMVLSVAMVLSTMGTVAFAAEDDADATTAFPGPYEIVHTVNEEKTLINGSIYGFYQTLSTMHSLIHQSGNHSYEDVSSSDPDLVKLNPLGTNGNCEIIVDEPFTGTVKVTYNVIEEDGTTIPETVEITCRAIVADNEEKIGATSEAVATAWDTFSNLNGQQFFIGDFRGVKDIYRIGFDAWDSEGNPVKVSGLAGVYTNNGWKSINGLSTTPSTVTTSHVETLFATGMFNTSSDVLNIGFALTGEIEEDTTVMITVYNNAAPASTFPTGNSHALAARSFKFLADPVAKIGDTYYATLADALAAVNESDAKEITVNMLADGTIDITAWQELAIGGENAEVIKIEGNGHTLTFNKLSNDWDNIATSNNAKLILNDMTITDSGYNSGTWNRYDIYFACDVELNGVTSTKALAFKAGATLNEVTINETDDNYAIWIQPNGQKVAIDGLNVNAENGRGIKIDEQYVDASKKVELTLEDATFTTAKKAAIVVKSKAGADIIAENVNIDNVAEDSENLVWVDAGAKDFQQNVTVNSKPAFLEGTVAKIGDIAYISLDDALAKAEAGETVEVLADAEITTLPNGYNGGLLNASLNLNGHTVTLKTTNIIPNGNITISNGTLDASGLNIDNAIFWLRDANTSLTLNKVVVNAKGANGTYIISNNGVDANINIINGSEINVMNDAMTTLSAVVAPQPGGNLTITDSTINAKNISGHTILHGKVVIDGESVINAENVGSGIYADNTSNSLSIEDTASVTVVLKEDAKYSGITLGATTPYTVAATATVNAIVSRTPAADGSNLAETVKLSFEPTDKQEVYNIYVEAVGEGKTINRMSAVQVKFALDNPNMSYTLAPASNIGVTLTNDIDNEKAYVFNYNGVKAPDATGAKLLLGTVTFGGYGKFEFTVDTTYEAKVKTAQLTDNIVEEYVPNPVAANAKQGKFDIDASAITGAEVVEAKRDVKVVIDFNNDITAGNEADYNDMWVTITGSNGEEWTGYVGSAPADDKKDDNILYFENTAETVEMTFKVTAGYRYTVVVNGAGYRTARYSTNVDAAAEPLVLNFWNNALENADRTQRYECIEEGEARSLKDVTFLAGDIAPDNIIDKYDLAAVVSYFGYDDLKVGKQGYVKYDLNRDGKIDADDISYVLVSWGK